MVYDPPRRLGLAVGLGALLILLGLDLSFLLVLRLDLGFLLVLSSNPRSMAAFLSLTLLLVSLPPLAVVGYRTYALWRSRYVLSRNAIVVEWGGRRIVLPMRLLDEARAGAEVEADLRPRGLSWPGNLFGPGAVAGLGEVEFLAGAEKAGLVLLRHAEAWLAISPADPQAFLAALAVAREAGPEVDVEPESVIPGVQTWALLHDRLALTLVTVGAASAVLLLGYLALIAPKLPPLIALHFDAQRTADRYGPPAGLLILPVIAGLTWLVNTLGSAWLHRNSRERAAAYLLLVATLFVQALVWVATITLLTAGNSA